jgi:hypothetical protein
MADGQEVKVIVKDNSGTTFGIIGLICSIISIFFLAIVFMPIGLILGIVATVKKSYGLGIAAILVAIIALFLSPTLYLALGLGSLFMR